METFLLKTKSGYYRSTPNGRYARFDAPKDQALPMCKDCLSRWRDVFRRIKMAYYAFEFHDILQQCPSCGKIAA